MGKIATDVVASIAAVAGDFAHPTSHAQKSPGNRRGFSSEQHRRDDGYDFFGHGTP